MCLYLCALIERIDNASLVVDLTISGDEIGYSRTALTTLYRAAQEGLTNAQKHAQASHVDIQIELGTRDGRLMLKDNGTGFYQRNLAEADSSRYNGFGLRGLKERLELVGGHMTIDSIPNQGTELYIVVPKDPLKSMANTPVRSDALAQKAPVE